jgi:hypothetical protein
MYALQKLIQNQKNEMAKAKQQMSSAMLRYIQAHINHKIYSMALRKKNQMNEFKDNNQQARRQQELIAIQNNFAKSQSTKLTAFKLLMGPLASESSSSSSSSSASHCCVPARVTSEMCLSVCW